MTNSTTGVAAMHSIIGAGVAYTTGVTAMDDAARAGAMRSDIGTGTKYSITDAVVTCSGGANASCATAGVGAMRSTTGAGAKYSNIGAGVAYTPEAVVQWCFVAQLGLLEYTWDAIPV